MSIIIVLIKDILHIIGHFVETWLYQSLDISKGLNVTQKCFGISQKPAHIWR